MNDMFLWLFKMTIAEAIWLLYLDTTLVWFMQARLGMRTGSGVEKVPRLLWLLRLNDPNSCLFVNAARLEIISSKQSFA